MGPRDGLEIFEKIKIPWPSLEPQVVQSVAYSDYTVLAAVVITVAKLIVSQPFVSGSFQKGAVTY